MRKNDEDSLPFIALVLPRLPRSSFFFFFFARPQPPESLKQAMMHFVSKQLKYFGVINYLFSTNQSKPHNRLQLGSITKLLYTNYVFTALFMAPDVGSVTRWMEQEDRGARFHS